MAAIQHSLAFSIPVFFIQIAVFVALVLVMRSIFWQPVLGQIDGRKQMLVDAYRTRDEIQHEMEALRADYIGRIALVEAEARQRVQTAVREAQAERERALGAARADAETALHAGTETMNKEKRDALVAMRDKMVGMAEAAVLKTVGETVDAAALRRNIEDSMAANSVSEARSQ